ncbi:MAG TPA: PAS domain S-box protein, partial [Tepidisphaeraceae bacterium]
MFGWSAEEVLGGPIPFLPPDKLDEHRAMRQRDLQSLGAGEYEIQRRHQDGSYLDLRVSTVPLRDAAGDVTALMSVYVDITESKRAQQRLLAQFGVARILAEAGSTAEAVPRVLRTLGENLGWVAGLWWQVDDEAQELRCAASWAAAPVDTAKMASRRFAPGEGLAARVFANREPAWISDIQQDPDSAGRRGAQEAGLRSAFGFPILSAGAVFGVMELFHQSVQPADRDVLEMAAALGYQIGDFFERQRAQQNLVDSEASYRALTETASDGIIAISGDSVIQFANGAACHMFGYSAEEMLGADLTMLMPEYLRELHKAGIARYQQTGRRHLSWRAVSVNGKHRDGHEIPLEISLGEYERNERIVFIGIVRDVTERKYFDEKLRQTAKLESLGLLAGGIAHDFNNLLTGILGNTSLALDMMPETHLAAGPLQDAIEASERAAHLTKQLLAYAGKGRFVVRPLDVSDLAREITALVKSTIPKNVQVRLDLDDRLPCIEGDATQLQQLLMNLVINGAEAIGEDQSGTVLVTTGAQDVDPSYIEQTFGESDIAPGRYVTLEVHDTGMGMDAATKAKIFDPFFTTKFTGRGLG